jgi:hypothetical protein
MCAEEFVYLRYGHYFDARMTKGSGVTRAQCNPGNLVANHQVRRAPRDHVSR